MKLQTHHGNGGRGPMGPRKAGPTARVPTKPSLPVPGPGQEPKGHLSTYAAHGRPAESITMSMKSPRPHQYPSFMQSPLAMGCATSFSITMSKVGDSESASTETP